MWSGLVNSLIADPWNVVSIVRIRAGTPSALLLQIEEG